MRHQGAVCRIDLVCSKQLSKLKMTQNEVLFTVAN